MKECTNCLYSHANVSCPKCGYVEDINTFDHVQTYTGYVEKVKKTKMSTIVKMLIFIILFTLFIVAIPLLNLDTKTTTILLLSIFPLMLLIVFIIAIVNILKSIKTERTVVVPKDSETTGTIIDYKWEPYRIHRARSHIFYFVRYPYHVYPIVSYDVNGKSYRVRSLTNFKGFVYRDSDKRVLNVNLKEKDRVVKVKYNKNEPINASVSYNLKQYMLFIMNRWFTILIIVCFLLTICNL